MASSTGDTHEELPARLDALLSSAIREKARDERALAEGFRAMREDLEAFSRDLTSIKKLVQRPFQPVLSLLGSRLQEVEELLSNFRTDVLQSLEASAGQQNDRVMQEARMVGKFVEDWSKYLDVRLREEGAGLRKLLEDSVASAETQLADEAGQIKGSLETSKQKASKDLERRMASAVARLDKVAEEIHLHLSNAEEVLRGDLEVAQEALLEAVGDSSDGVSEVLNEVTSVVQRQIGQSLAEGLKPFSKEVQKLGEQIDEAGRRMEESNARLEAIQGSLISYLSERDERLERVRDQALIDLVERMSDAFTGRSKAKVVNALREGDRRRKDARDAQRYRESAGGKGTPKNPEDWPKDWIEQQAGQDSGAPWLSDSK